MIGRLALGMLFVSLGLAPARAGGFQNSDDKKPDAGKADDSAPSPDLKRATAPTAKSTARTSSTRSRREPTVAIDGKLIKVDATEKTLTLEISRKYGILDAGEAAAMADLQTQLSAAYRLPNYAERIRRVQSLQRDIAQRQMNAVHSRDSKHNVDFQTADDVEIRLANPPAAYDDKGNSRKLSSRELADLKGPHRDWGYASDFDSLHPDVLVRVYVPKKDLTRPRTAPRPSDESKTDKDKPSTPPRLLVVTIHVLGEARK